MPFHAMAHFLEAHPDLAVFLVVGLGYLVGKLKYRGFGPGPVTGALFAGLLVGQFAEVPVSDTAKSILFLLFLFGIGYSVGPKFLSAVRGDGLPGVAIGIVVPLAAIATAVVVARVLGLDPGFAAGMFSGATTESPAIGTAAEAIRALPIPQDRKALLVGHIAVADALCYLFGALGVILMTTLVGPWILGIDVREEARRLEEKYGLAKSAAGGSAWRAVELRAYEIPAEGRVAGMTVREAEAALGGQRAFILRLRRDGAVLDATPETILRAGDVVAVTARRAALVEAIGPTAREVEDRELLDVPTLALDVYVSSRDVVGRTLAELGARESTRGVFVSRILRSALDIPVGPQAAIERGDVVTLVGPAPAVEAVAARAGAAIRASDPTDFVTLGLAIFLGGLMGTLVAIDIGAAHVSLSVSVGTLVAGLFVGWLRSRRPVFAHIPDGAVALMTSLGLAAFVGMIGLLAGGVVVTLVPQLVGLLVGRYVLRMNPLLLLGALAGAQTMTAALAALQDRSGSPIAVLGYTAAVPFGHILLTTGGTVVVWLMA